MSFLKSLVLACHNIADKLAGCIDPEVRSDAVYGAWRAYRTFDQTIGGTPIGAFCRLAGYRHAMKGLTTRRAKAISQLPAEFEAPDRQPSPLDALIAQEEFDARPPTETKQRVKYARRLGLASRFRAA